ncbi:hypothetical protein [Archangium sp.]|uniref:hypothetical protein n=1 Tax=Archangium sp. TaxID=1872627 RepID=UPI00286BE156|nr:hypothetical protein [Archangium sp.]
MRHALALLAVAFLVAGCPKKTGENNDAGPVDNPSYRDAGQQTPPPATPEDSGTQAQGITTPSDATTAMESCVDRWLEGKKLDRYGHPEGTMYAGGSPLFNEATGESKDRMEYVFARQPEARKACAAAKSGQ